MKCGVEDFELLSVYSCFDVVMGYVYVKILLFCFRICMEIANGTKLLSYVISNFVMKDIFVEQFFALINPAYDLSPVHTMPNLIGLGQIY